MAVATLEHPGCKPADKPQRGIVVEHHGALDVVPAFQRLGQRPPDRPAGIVDQDVDPADALFDVFDQRVDRFHVREVAGERHRRAAVAGDPVRHRIQQILTARDGNHDGAVQSELFGRGRTDA
ncbi:Uncharacterised protein [Mycobacterium tuberculosis]|uniref:Uncharacterized protein n=1 Tax=Mycobacterium tuberculosis TaxID=1773 RepID=A0A655FY96_MYCTX|nr:Uncharacterised protein [Mycobacterium tuberculosis]CNL61345.1 Uncharacterised protein [Mycobacterium tuberculosis]CNL71614.1 Uncharacterised protein [Mycobacterium tuberculosis]CNN53278.1 Uncharacterised protein [Mycobacterium tuberculosis]CNV92724.1 Uncharacterised protein [Mycobacterium tuberculosis]